MNSPKNRIGRIMLTDMRTFIFLQDSRCRDDALQSVQLFHDLQEIFPNKIYIRTLNIERDAHTLYQMTSSEFSFNTLTLMS